MKRLTIIVMISLNLNPAHAQVLGGFFNQQQSKVQVLLQQVAGLETYLKAMKEGYKATENGLSTIHNLKNGSFDLHQSYFNSLASVSPAVRNNPKIPEITTDQQRIVDAFKSELSWQRQQAILNSDEISYIERVNNTIISACNKDIDELNLALSSGTQMADEERISRVDQLYAATIDKYQFTQSFIHQTHQFALDRKNGREQTKDIKKLYNIN